MSRQQHLTTSLRGPPSASFVYDVAKKIMDAASLGDVYEEWAPLYDPAFEVPSTLGSN
ncbi:hypothetical protein JVU11DRAFT_10147 [Chiua virens]|nr:hypothetical protein JVU11DRAFT_10147 [Chiua virens]